MARKKIAQYVYDLGKMEMPDILKLAPETRKKVLRQGARIIALEARRTAPDSGKKHENKLNKTIGYRARRNGLEMAVVVMAPHAHLVHDGTRAHAIAPKTLESARRGFRFYHGSMNPLQHPGARSQPFLTDAGETKRAEVEEALIQGAMEAWAEIAVKS
jgi:HK97 gp10 family phage protein